MDIQLQFPPAERLNALRRGLQELSYNEESICRRTGLTAIFDFTIEGQAKVPALDDSLDALILLFLCGDGVPEERANALLPADFIAVLAECGLVVQLGSSGEYFGTVQLYPVESLYIVSDRPLPLDGSMASNRPDVVFTAISWNTEQFLACMPAVVLRELARPLLRLRNRGPGPRTRRTKRLVVRPRPAERGFRRIQPPSERN